jgi:hypothetical protein
MDSNNNNERGSSISYYEFQNYVYGSVIPPPPLPAWASKTDDDAVAPPGSSEERLSLLGFCTPSSRSSKYGTRVVQVNEGETNLNAEVEEYVNNVTTPFKFKFAPSEMRQLALVAHNHMKPAMATFIKTYSEILKKFRITGTQTTMLMCKQLWGKDNPDIEEKEEGAPKPDAGAEAFSAAAEAPPAEVPAEEPAPEAPAEETPPAEA